MCTYVIIFVTARHITNTAGSPIWGVWFVINIRKNKRSMRRRFRLISVLLVAMMMTMSFASTAFAVEDLNADGPSSAEDVIVFDLEPQGDEPPTGDGDETELKNGVYLEEGSYYLYINDVMQKAQKVLYEGKWYFAKADGKLARNELLKIEGAYYYAGSDCALAEGVFTNDKGASYYADEDKKVNTEEKVININGSDTYTTKSGQIKSNQFVTDSKGNLHYLGANGKLAMGVFKAADGYKYYADENGVVLTTSQKVSWNGKSYIVKEGGRLASDQIGFANGLAYWVNKDCTVRTSTFAYVKISTQKMYFYKNGKNLLATSVITGKLSTPTPTGDFAVTGKARNVRLTGPDWDVTVSYWISFVGSSIGFHDANWRSSWMFNDSNYYKANGSHGCVNMRTADATKLYNNIAKGTVVIVRK